MSSELNEEVLLRGEKQSVHPVVFDDIDESIVKEAALKTKGGSGPSELDADGWRKERFLSCEKINADLRRAFANIIKKMCTEKLPVNTPKEPLETFLACRFIPLAKNPELRPIRVGEVLQRIAGKVLMKVVKEDIKKPGGCLQLRACQEAGCEAAIHVKRKIFESNETEAILIIDADAFNSINRKALLHNIEYLCPVIATLLYN